MLRNFILKVYLREYAHKNRKKYGRVHKHIHTMCTLKLIIAYLHSNHLYQQTSVLFRTTVICTYTHMYRCNTYVFLLYITDFLFKAILFISFPHAFSPVVYVENSHVNLFSDCLGVRLFLVRRFDALKTSLTNPELG